MLKLPLTTVLKYVIRICSYLSISELFLSGDDHRVISGESGAVSLGALSHISKYDTEIRKKLEIDENSKILLISTEGDTDPEGFIRLVGKP